MQQQESKQADTSQQAFVAQETMNQEDYRDNVRDFEEEREDYRTMVLEVDYSDVCRYREVARTDELGAYFLKWDRREMRFFGMRTQSLLEGLFASPNDPRYLEMPARSSVVVEAFGRNPEYLGYFGIHLVKPMKVQTSEPKVRWEVEDAD